MRFDNQATKQGDSEDLALETITHRCSDPVSEPQLQGSTLPSQYPSYMVAILERRVCALSDRRTERPSRLLRASVRHTDAFSGEVYHGAILQRSDLVRKTRRSK